MPSLKRRLKALLRRIFGGRPRPDRSHALRRVCFCGHANGQPFACDAWEIRPRRGGKPHIVPLSGSNWQTRRDRVSLN